MVCAGWVASYLGLGLGSGLGLAVGWDVCAGAVGCFDLGPGLGLAVAWGASYAGFPAPWACPVCWVVSFPVAKAVSPPVVVDISSGCLLSAIDMHLVDKKRTQAANVQDHQVLQSSENSSFLAGR